MVADAEADGGLWSSDAMRECLKERVGEGDWSDRECFPGADGGEVGEVEGWSWSRVLRRLCVAAAWLSDEEGEGLGPVEDGDDFGSYASASPAKEEAPSREGSLAPGLILVRLAALKGSVKCVAETVDVQREQRRCGRE